MKFLLCFFAAALIKISQCQSQHSFISQDNLLKDGPKIIVEYKKAEIHEDSYEEVESQCRSVDGVEFPVVMRNLRNELKKILNTEKYQQKLSTTKCLNVNEKCSDNPHHYSQKSICRQIQSRITLITIDEKDELKEDVFEFPSHCICELMTLRI